MHTDSTGGIQLQCLSEDKSLSFKSVSLFFLLNLSVMGNHYHTQSKRNTETSTISTVYMYMG